MWRLSCDSSIVGARRGLSLAEVLLSATLVLLVMGLAIGFLVPLMGMQRSRAESAEVEQRGAIVTEELRRDLALTNSSGVSLVRTPGELLLGIHGADNVAQDGTLVWSDRLVIYSWRSSEHLWRRGIWSDGGRSLLRAGGATRLDESGLRRAVAESTLTRQTPGVAAVDFQQTGGFPVQLTMSLVTAGGARREIVRTLAGRLPTP